MTCPTCGAAMREVTIGIDMAVGEPRPVVEFAVLQVCVRGVEVHAQMFGRELGPVKPLKYDWE